MDKKPNQQASLQAPPSSSLLISISSAVVNSWLLPVAGFHFLTVNSIQAIYRSRDDPWEVAFVVSAYVVMLLFFCFLHAMERLTAAKSGSGSNPAAEKKEKRLKVAVLVLAPILNLMFSYRASTMLPTALAVVVWVVAGSTSLAGFFVFFTVVRACDTTIPRLPLPPRTETIDDSQSSPFTSPSWKDFFIICSCTEGSVRDGFGCH